jgi:hypothetical protein
MDVETEERNDCAGEGQQQFNRQTDCDIATLLGVAAMRNYETVDNR